MFRLIIFGLAAYGVTQLVKHLAETDSEAGRRRRDDLPRPMQQGLRGQPAAPAPLF